MSRKNKEKTTRVHQFHVKQNATNALMVVVATGEGVWIGYTTSLPADGRGVLGSLTYWPIYYSHVLRVNIYIYLNNQRPIGINSYYSSYTMTRHVPSYVSAAMERSAPHITQGSQNQRRSNSCARFFLYLRFTYTTRITNQTLW